MHASMIYEVTTNPTDTCAILFLVSKQNNKYQKTKSEAFWGKK